MLRNDLFHVALGQLPGPRCAGGPPENSLGTLLRSEPAPTLESAVLDDGASATGPHAGAIPVLALTTPDIWLIRTFHDEVWVPELTGEQWVDDREECTFLALIPARETLRAKTPRLSRNNAQ
jgi:hypothetical protein